MKSETEVGRRCFGSESGMALLITLMVLAVTSLLGLSLAFNATIDGSISANNEAGTQAYYIAEAGLNHAVDMVIRSTKWNPYLAGADGDPARTADNGILSGSLVPQGCTAIPAGGLAFGKGRYEVQLLDDDFDTRYNKVSDYAWTAQIPNVVTHALFGLREDGNVYNDINGRVLIRSTGFAPHNTRATVEAILGPVPMPAILTELDLQISSSLQLTGLGGAVHSNGDLTITGNPNPIEKYATASKNFTITGNPTIAGSYLDTPEEKEAYASGHKGMPRVEVPDISPNDYKSQADYILGADGIVYDGQTGAALTASAGDAFCGWKRSGTGPVMWDQVGSVCQATYYVEGNIQLGGTIGTKLNPHNVTILAKGSIEISGDSYLEPDIPGVLFVAGGDIKLNGNTSFGQGMIYAGDDLMISGNPPINGNIIARNVDPPSSAGVKDLVQRNEISGEARITFNGGSSRTFALISWRELRNP